MSQAKGSRRDGRVGDAFWRISGTAHSLETTTEVQYKPWRQYHSSAAGAKCLVNRPKHGYWRFMCQAAPDFLIEDDFLKTKIKQVRFARLLCCCVRAYEAMRFQFSGGRHCGLG